MFVFLYYLFHLKFFKIWNTSDLNFGFRSIGNPEKINSDKPQTCGEK